MITFHEKIHKTLKQFRIKKMVPHLLLFGKHGTGKKTIIHNFLYDIYETHENIEKYVMIVDCAHGKGIKFVRDDIKFFAKTNISTINGRFKTIVLLHADKLTTDAQSALRRCIELFSSSTRFFMVVENRHNLLKPIISRFCEIYVPMPEPVQGRNCYQLQIHNCVKQNSYTWLEDLLVKWFTSLSKTPTSTRYCDTNVLHPLALSMKIYEKGFCCLDIIHLVETKPKKFGFDDSDVVFHILDLETYKREFLDEKTYIYYCLNYLVFRLIGT